MTTPNFHLLINYPHFSDDRHTTNMPEEERTTAMFQEDLLSPLRQPHEEFVAENQTMVLSKPFGFPNLNYDTEIPEVQLYEREDDGNNRRSVTQSQGALNTGGPLNRKTITKFECAGSHNNLQQHQLIHHPIPIARLQYVNTQTGPSFNETSSFFNNLLHIKELTHNNHRNTTSNNLITQINSEWNNYTMVLDCPESSISLSQNSKPIRKATSRTFTNTPRRGEPKTQQPVTQSMTETLILRTDPNPFNKKNLSKVLYRLASSYFLNRYTFESNWVEKLCDKYKVDLGNFLDFIEVANKTMWSSFECVKKLWSHTDKKTINPELLTNIRKYKPSMLDKLTAEDLQKYGEYYRKALQLFFKRLGILASMNKVHKKGNPSVEKTKRDDLIAAQQKILSLLGSK